jgi:hypothetical protein
MPRGQGIHGATTYFHLEPAVFTPAGSHPALKVCRGESAKGPYLWAGDDQTGTPLGILSDPVQLRRLHRAIGVIIGETT